VYCKQCKDKKPSYRGRSKYSASIYVNISLASRVFHVNKVALETEREKKPRRLLFVGKVIASNVAIRLSADFLLVTQGRPLTGQGRLLLLTSFFASRNSFRVTVRSLNHLVSSSRVH